MEIEIEDLIYVKVHGLEGYVVVIDIFEDPVILVGHLGADPDEARRLRNDITGWRLVRVALQDAVLVEKGKPSRPTEKICTCTTLDLFRAGCGCGAITPYKQVY